MFLFGLPLSMENFIIFIPLGLSIAPPIAFLSFFYLFFFKNTLFSSPIVKRIIFLYVYAICFSLIFLLFSLLYSNSGVGLFISFLRQAISLTIGIICFFVLRGFFFYFGYKAVKWIILGSIPTLLICIIQISSYFVGFYQGVDFIDQLRFMILGPHISHNLGVRVSGLTAEPSHLGAYLSLILVPAIFLLFNRNSQAVISRKMLKTILFLTLLCLFFTISGTTIIIILAMTISYFVISKQYSFKNISIFIFFSAVVIVSVAIIPNNYVLHQFINFSDGGLSWVGKYGSSLGPIIMVGETGNIFGYGLGGTQSNIQNILPQEWREFLIKLDDNRTDPDNMRLKTLLGKIVAEMGLVGLLIFTAIIIKAISLTKINHQGEKNILIPTIIGVFVASSSGNIGSFAHPFLWLWIAFIDGLRVRRNEDDAR